MSTETTQAQKMAFSLPTKEMNIEGPADMEKEFPLSDIKELHIDLPTAKILLTKNEEQSIKIRIQGLKEYPHLFPQTLLSGQSLQVYQKLVPGVQALLEQKKMYTVEISLPEHLSVNLLMISGEVFIDHLSGPFSGEIKLGNIQGIYQGSDITTRVYAGHVKIHSLSGNAHIFVAAGSIELDWEKLSPTSNVEVTCGLGDIALRFPKEQEARSISHAGFLRKTQIRNQGGALVSASVGVGNLWIG